MVATARVSDVVVRMPPSPTGALHLGTARTALFNWLFAKKNGGKMIFRWEDTDQERSKTEYEEAILSGLQWLGMDFLAESEFYRQTENLAVHKQYLDQLWAEQKIFPCFASKETIASMRDQANKDRTNFVFWSPDRDLDRDRAEQKILAGDAYVWRFKTPTYHQIKMQDAIRGNITVQADTIGDFAVARGDGSVLYLLANVVDDATQGVTHIIRGEDHISNTPKQILLYQALGFVLPIFAHIPLVLDASRKKLSKRNVDPNICVLIPDFQQAGFLPEAVVNGLAFLGWNPRSTEEIFSFEQLGELFSLDQVNAAAAQYDFDKMLWFNAQWMRRLPIESLQASYQAFAGKSVPLAALAVAREKARTLVELGDELSYLLADPGFDAGVILHPKMCPSFETALPILRSIATMLDSISSESFDHDTVKQQSIATIKSLGLKNGAFLWPFRAVLSNRDGSAGPFDIAAILGKELTLKRINRAIEVLEGLV